MPFGIRPARWLFALREYARELFVLIEVDAVDKL